MGSSLSMRSENRSRQPEERRLQAGLELPELVPVVVAGTGGSARRRRDRSRRSRAPSGRRRAWRAARRRRRRSSCTAGRAGPAPPLAAGPGRRPRRSLRGLAGRGRTSGRGRNESRSPSRVVVRPPTCGWRSSTVTRRPARASNMAAARPPGPAPMITTRLCRMMKAPLQKVDHQESMDSTFDEPAGPPGAQSKVSQWKTNGGRDKLPRRRSTWNQSIAISLMVGTGSKDLGHPERSVVEDRFQFGLDHPGMNQTAQRSKGEDVVNLVTHQCSAIHWLESVRMVPEPVGAPELHVYELVRRLPCPDLGHPLQGQPVQADQVVNPGPGPHDDRFGRNDPKPQPGRCDGFQIPGFGEEREYLFNRSGQPLFAPAGCARPRSRSSTGCLDGGQRGRGRAQDEDRSKDLAQGCDHSLVGWGKIVQRGFRAKQFQSGVLDLANALLGDVQHLADLAE